MAILLVEKNDGRIIHVRMSGKLTHADYDLFGPEFDRLVKMHGKVSLMVEMVDFHGWEGSAVWDDVKLDLKHFNDISRIAMVGETKWEKGMSVFCKPFTTAKIRYFDRSAITEARAWLAEEALASKSTSRP